MGRKRALLIAVYEFEDKDISPLFAPKEDAEALKSVLEDPAIGGFEVRLLPFDADLDQVRKCIQEFFVDSGPDDLLLLYYSGHGIKRDNSLYLAIKDTQLKTLKYSAVSFEHDIKDIMDDCPRPQKVLILDCCYSGKAITSKSDEISNICRQLVDQKNVMLTSSNEIQSSFESKEKGSCSLFTRKLVAGLKTGGADLDRDGKISIWELYRFIRDSIREDMSQQSPKIYPELRQEDIFIAKNPFPSKESGILKVTGCPICDVDLELKAESKFCPHCGTNVEKFILDPEKCPVCNSPIISDKSRFCSGCGVEFKRRLGTSS